MQSSARQQSLPSVRQSRRQMISAAASAVILGTWKPQRAFSADAPAKRTVLIVASGANTLALRNGTFPIGVFLNELAIPAMELLKSGYALVLATPQGNKPTIDKRSVNEAYFAGQQALEEAQSFMEHDPAMQNLRSLPSLLEEGVDQYAGLFVPGGHGPEVDLIQDPSLGIILRRFHELQKPTALLCHGPAALISAMLVVVLLPRSTSGSGRPLRSRTLPDSRTRPAASNGSSQVTTGTAMIVEDSPVDQFWGSGADETGENWAGRILMEVRDRTLKHR